jgi:hypothetical protein
VDDRCHTVCFVAAGAGERLYDGLFHSHTAGHRNRCDTDWGHSGTKTRISDGAKIGPEWAPNRTGARQLVRRDVHCGTSTGNSISSYSSVVCDREA